MNDDPVYIGDVWSAMQVSDLSDRIWQKVEQAIREEGLIPHARGSTTEVSTALYRYLRNCELPTTLAPVEPAPSKVCPVVHVPSYGPPVRCTLDAEPPHKFHQGTTEHGTITWSHAMGR